MSDYQSQHRRSGRPMDYTDSGSGTGLWIVLGLLAVIALIGVIMAGAASTNGLMLILSVLLILAWKHRLELRNPPSLRSWVKVWEQKD